MNTQLLELRKTLAKQASENRNKMLYEGSQIGLHDSIQSTYVNYLLGKYIASRKAWWTVVEMMRDASDSFEFVAQPPSSDMTKTFKGSGCASISE